MFEILIPLVLIIVLLMCMMNNNSEEYFSVGGPGCKNNNIDGFREEFEINSAFIVISFLSNWLAIGSHSRVIMFDQLQML